MPTHCHIPMGSRPRLVNFGNAEHGFRGREEYRLPALWCLHLYFYKVEMQVGRSRYSVVPGSVTIIPPGERIVYHYTARRHRHFYVHFGLKRALPLKQSPVFKHLPEAKDEIFDRLENIQRICISNRSHAEILFWGLLWDVVEAGRRKMQAEGELPRLVQAVDQHIENELPGKITAAGIARHHGLSQTHINRLVKAAHGVTTIQLIRRRRLQRAYRLLLHSTMPINLVAAECGITDLQQFNKLMRNEYGKSPRSLREHRLEKDDPTWSIDRN